SSATRRAPSRAASRRGSSTTISPSTPASSSARGTRVVLPAPGGASSTRLGTRSSDATISGRSGSIGSGVSLGNNRSPRAGGSLLLLRARLGHLQPALLLLRLQALRLRSSLLCRLVVVPLRMLHRHRRSPSRPPSTGSAPLLQAP